MKKVFACMLSILISVCFVQFLYADYYGTYAHVEGWHWDIWDNYFDCEDSGVHTASCECGNEVATVYARSDAYPYLHKAEAYVQSWGISAFACFIADSEFWDTYRAEVEPGSNIEWVMLGMYVHFNGLLEADGYGWSGLDFNISITQEEVYENALLYEAHAWSYGEAYSRYWLAPGVEIEGALGEDDLIPTQYGYEIIPNFYDTIYFLVKPNVPLIVDFDFCVGAILEGGGLGDWAHAAFYDTGKIYVFPADENIISFTSESGQLGPVPIPSTLLLFGSGLFGLIGMRRRFKK